MASTLTIRLRLGRFTSPQFQQFRHRRSRRTEWAVTGKPALYRLRRAACPVSISTTTTSTATGCAWAPEETNADVQLLPQSDCSPSRLYAYRNARRARDPHHCGGTDAGDRAAVGRA